MTNSIEGKLGLLVLSGWIAAGPPDGREYAWLLMSTPGTPDAPPQATMPAVAEVLGLNPQAGSLTPDPSDVATLTISGDLWAALRVGDERWERPVSAEWADLARDRGRVVLAIPYLSMLPGMTEDDMTNQMMATNQFALGSVPVVGS